MIPYDNEYWDTIDKYEDALPPESFQHLLAEEAQVALTAFMDETGTIINSRAFLSVLITYGEYAKQHLRRNMPVAWGENE